MIDLAHPLLLWFILLIPLAASLQWWWYARARRTHASTGASVEPLRRHSSLRTTIRSILLWSGLACAVLALAGPRWGEAEQTRRAAGADLLIAFDCSRSMLATDLFPDRLRLARRKAIDLLGLAPDMRVALLPFAATAALRCPLTGDHLAVATLLEDCDPELFPAEAGLQGTSIGSAVRTGLDILARESGAGQAILVISDGADPDAEAVKAATTAASARGIPVYGLFIGDPERRVEVTIDGTPVTMSTDRSTLDQLATGSGAITVNATVNDDDVAALATHLSDHLARRPWEERSRSVAIERYQWPLGVALALLGLGWLLPTGRRAALGLLVVCCYLIPSPATAGEPWRELEPIIAQAANDPAGARAALVALLVQHPDSAAAHYNLGCLLLPSDATSAARHFEAATRAAQVDLSADAWHNLALARLQLGQLDEALAAADQALKQRPEIADFTRTRDEVRRAVLAREDAKRLAAEAAAKRLRLVTTTLPPARLKETYDGVMIASGGTAPYRFSAKTVPEGLQVTADGHVRGSPTKAGTSALAITVDDAAKGGATGTVTLVVLPAPAITTTALPEAIVNLPYRAELQCEGLIDPRWTISGLPTGLSATTTAGRAVISGTPTTQGTSTVQATATDVGHQAQRTLTLVVSDTFAPAESMLPPATAFAEYQHRLTVRGRAMAYRWIHAKPESGITIAADGSVSGAPAQAGALTLHATIAAADGRTRAVEVTLPVNPPPVIDEEAKLTLTRGQAVDRPLKVSGGTPPYRWSGHGGPAGIRVDADGHLRGSPSVVGESELTLACEDRWQAGTELKITVVVEERQDQDDKKEDKKEDPKDDQQQQDEKTPDQKPGDPSPDQTQQPKPSDQPQADAPKPDNAAKPGDSAPQSKPSPSAGAPEQKQAVSAAEQAADRWIENLPKDDREGLRLQLLQGAKAPAKQSDKPW